MVGDSALTVTGIGSDASQAVSPPRRPSAFPHLSRLDVLALAALLALWAAVLIVRYDAVPLQLWDESRNANNALEMVWHGRWLVPTYGGVPDHWNTKPPLLIWMQAAGLRLGLPTLVALRLASWLAAAATAGALWGVLRISLRDRLAAFVAPALLLSATLYIGPHAARTGDYDALESAFVLGYALAFWKAVVDGRVRWLALAAALMALGVLTKGVAALLPAPGLMLFALTRPSRTAGWVQNARVWAAAALFVLPVGIYYLAREALDPGYLHVVAGNELGGRFLQVSDNHREPWDFYLQTLLEGAEPCAVLSVLGLVTLFGRDPRRRSLALVVALAAGSLLTVVSAARSKLAWYATPVIPMLSLLAGLGLSDALRRMRPRWAVFAHAAAGLTLTGGAAWALWWSQSGASWPHGPAGGAHFRYGPLLQAIGERGLGPRVTVVDQGFPNDAGFADYDPMLKVYAGLAARRGLALTVVRSPDSLIPGETVASCDAAAWASFSWPGRLQPLLVRQGCIVVRIIGVPPQGRAGG